MRQIVFLLEEPSAEALLQELLPRLLPDSLTYRFLVFEGKQDLDKQLMRRIRGYRMPGARFFILRDQDKSDCKRLKASVLEKCREAGRPNSVVRIACKELESWYLADLFAVEVALGEKGLSNRQGKKMYQVPDQLDRPSGILEKIAPNYQHISGSRLIGKRLNLENNRSKSFMCFVRALRRLSHEMGEGVSM